MKISMWILKEWFSDCDIEAVIIDGSKTIEGIRVFANQKTLDTKFVYISNVSDVFLNNASDVVLLMHCNDVISISNVDMETVLNQAQEAFEFYNNWELTLNKAVRSDVPEQMIIDACEDLLGPMFMIDLGLNLIARSMNYSIGEINECWDDLIKYDNFSLETLFQLRKSMTITLIPEKHSCSIYDNLFPAPYNYGMLVSYCTNNNEVIGQLFILSDKPITHYELHLAEHIEQALYEINSNNVKEGTSKYAEGILSSILLHNEIDEYEIQKLLLLQEWEPDSGYFFIEIKMMDAEESVPHSQLAALIREIPDGIFIIINGAIVGVLRTKEDMQTYEVLERITCKGGNLIGISNKFFDVHDILTYSRQAKDCIKYRLKGPKGVFRFHHCALYAFIESYDMEYSKRAIHPGIIFLKDYDKKHSTEFYGTLRCFLQQGKSSRLTARELFIHKNTVIYRMGKIMKLFDFDFDSPYECEYILTSYRVLDAVEGIYLNP